MLSQLAISTLVVVTLHLVNGNPMSLNNECPKVNGQYPVRFAHPGNCNAYYTCDWGVAILQYCPPGLHFGWIGVCDLPEKARCSGSSVAAVPVGTLEAKVADSQVKTLKMDVDHLAPDSRCPGTNPVIPHFFRHSTDCSRYYVCDWGVAIPMYCAPGLAFNERLNTCDFRQNVQC